MAKNISAANESFNPLRLVFHIVIFIASADSEEFSFRVNYIA
jgi:hypothetical protein